MILITSPGGPEKAATAREILPGLNGASGVTGVGAVVALKGCLGEKTAGARVGAR